MNLPFQFFMYWFIVRENFNLNHVCENNAGKLGYCMTNLQCSDIVQGTVIGPCMSETVLDSGMSETVLDSGMSETTGNVCCYKTLNFYNETYFMQPIFTVSNRDLTSKTDTKIYKRLHNIRATNYINKPILPDTPLKHVPYDENIHICIHPDKIQWLVKYSIDDLEESRRIFGLTVNLSLVTFDKVYDEGKKNLTIECLLNSNVSLSEVSESEDGVPKYYNKGIDVDDLVPLRKFLTPEIQNLRPTTYKDDTESLFEETNSQEFKRRMLNYQTLQENQNVEKLVDSDTVGMKKPLDDNLPSRSEL